MSDEKNSLLRRLEQKRAAQSTGQRLAGRPTPEPPAARAGSARATGERPAARPTAERPPAGPSAAARTTTERPAAPKHTSTSEIPASGADSYPMFIKPAPPAPPKRKDNSGVMLIGAVVLLSVVVIGAVVVDYAGRLRTGTAPDVQFVQSLLQPPAGVEIAQVSGGAPAPDFSVNTLNGGQFSLAAQSGRVVVVHFFASWCGYCRRDAPHLESLYQSYTSVEFIGISVDDTIGEARSAVSDWGISYPVGVDQYVAWNYGVTGIPATFVVGRDGSLVASLIGSGNNNRLTSAIEAALR